jgi:hypothetical protein
MAGRVAPAKICLDLYDPGSKKRFSQLSYEIHAGKIASHGKGRADVESAGEFYE